MKLFQGSIAAIVFALIAGCASEKTNEPEVWSSSQTGERRVEQTDAVRMTATVEAIDLEKRLLTLKGPKGDTCSFIVDEAVKNLPQVKVGDRIQATYFESLAVEVKDPGQAIPGAAAAEGIKTAAPGEKPAGTGTRVVVVIATVEGIDRVKGTITLKGAQGNSITMKARDSKNLEKVKVGDLLEITYTQALAIAVEKLPEN